MPSASILRLDSPSTRCAESSCERQIRSASCSTQPGCGNVHGIGADSMAMRFPRSLYSAVLALVVPSSSESRYGTPRLYTALYWKKIMFFRRQKVHVLTFDEHIQKLKQAGFQVVPKGPGVARSIKHNCAADVKDADGTHPLIGKAGILI